MGGLDGWSEAEVEVDTVSTRCFSEAGRFSTTVSSHAEGDVLLILVLASVEVEVGVWSIAGDHKRMKYTLRDKILTYFRIGN
jgi:hypothetical protein